MSEYKPNNQTIKAGEIETRQTRRGLEFWAYNLQRGEPVCIGTQLDRVYEKVQPVFRQRKTFNITRAEYAAILEAGASFINIVLPDKSMMYSIGVERFARYAQPYDHSQYGSQLCCPLKYFSPSDQVSPRNQRRDNPPLEVAKDIIEERRQQMDLFR